MLLQTFFDGVAYLFHKPHRGGSSPTDAYVFFVVEPLWLDFVGRRDLMGIGIGTTALFIENFAVAAFATAYEQYKVV